MNLKITGPKNLTGTSVCLPSSKSISNRVLIINALSYSPFEIKNLSDSDDSIVLEQALNSNRSAFDIGHAGTAMRFLTAFLSKIAGEWVVTGSERMKQRPIGILVDALNELGAKIEYMENEGFPPLRIYGSHLKGKTLEIDGSISSQYISALLMIAPVMEDGLTLRFKGDVTSQPYIDMTLSLMKEFGVQHFRKNNEIHVPEQRYLPVEYTVEADWSGASYWYEIMALAGSGTIFLENLKLNSLQGDAQIAPWFEKFGIVSEQKENGVMISCSRKITPAKLETDFVENPDIAQTMACLCVASGIPFYFKGLKTLKIKETDRVAALIQELKKFGALLTEPQPGELQWDGKIGNEPATSTPLIQTYHDHRMALAFAPMALAGAPVVIEDAAVITKSYPRYWQDLSMAGFQVAEA